MLTEGKRTARQRATAPTTGVRRFLGFPILLAEVASGGSRRGPEPVTLR